MEVQWIDCRACSTRTHADEFEVKKGIKLKTCKRCLTKSKAYYEANKCQHGKQPSRCGECDGVGICQHKKQKTRCVQCNGGGICQHRTQRAQCKQCTNPQTILIRRWIEHSKETDKLRKQETNITREFCTTIITESGNRCCYCAVELQMLERNANLMTIERIDNRLGHVVGNCRVACFHCNCAKVGQRPI
jgi:hypothetical protein